MSLATPTTGLYFVLNGVILLSGDSVLNSYIGHQSYYHRSVLGSTLVCVTANVNTACCRAADNNGVTNSTAGAVGEWHYPNGSLVPRPRVHVVDFARIGFFREVRLARQVSDSIPPLGVYTCEVPDPFTGVLYSASIIISNEGSALEK